MTRAIHDGMFRRVFSEMENARSFLREVLPAKLAARLDWGSLDRRPESYVDAVLRSKYSDLVFSVRLQGKRQAFVYILFEHQREPDDVMPFRLLVYMTRIWEDFLVNHPKERLPVILPIVLSQGPESWRAATRFVDVLDIEPEERELVAGLVPSFSFVLLDLSHKSDEDLRTNAMDAHVRILLWFLKNAEDDEAILESLSRWHEVFLELLQKPTGLEALQTFLQYIFWASNQKVTPEAFNNALEAAGDPRVRKIQEAVVTVAEMLEKKGEERGLRLGEAKAVLRVLAKRGLAVSDELRNRILSCGDSAVLERWLDAAVTAKSASEIIGE